MPNAGSAYNQDGRSSGLTAPNGPAQTALVHTAIAVAGAAPEQVGLVSLHGTGTPLGDPIEVNALGQGLKGSTHHTVALGKNPRHYSLLEWHFSLLATILTIPLS